MRQAVPLSHHSDLGKAPLAAPALPAGFPVAASGHVHSRGSSGSSHEQQSISQKSAAKFSPMIIVGWVTPSGDRTRMFQVAA